MRQAAALANLALAGLDREFPNEPSNVLGSAASVVTPKEMFPAFYGCFDWHSSVHGHWLLVRVLRHFPELSQANEIRSRLAAHFTAVEPDPKRRPFLPMTSINRTTARVRLGLAAEISRRAASLGRPRSQAVASESASAGRSDRQANQSFLSLCFLIRFEPVSIPIPDLRWDEFSTTLVQRKPRAGRTGRLRRAKEYFLGDRDYPTRYEPSGQDFFSSGWNEADLMRRILEPAGVCGVVRPLHAWIGAR
jgi:hypothetical protein